MMGNFNSEPKTQEFYIATIPEHMITLTMVISPLRGSE